MEKKPSHLRQALKETSSGNVEKLPSQLRRGLEATNPIQAKLEKTSQFKKV